MHHFLPATPSTVHWGFFDPRLPPAVVVASGDLIQIETLTHHAGDAPDLLMDDGVAAVFDSVTDRGPGIPPDKQDKIFDWFESHANGSRHRGAGLGLSLVRSFVELHGGKVSIDSTVGRGTTVSCDFPLDQSAHRNAAE